MKRELGKPVTQGDPSMPRRLTLVSVGAFLGLAAPAAAQVCGGFTSFANGAYQVSGAVQFNDQAKMVGGAFALGGRAAFGQVGVGTTSYDNLDGSTFSLMGSAGYQVALDKKGVFQMCPVATIDHGSDPDGLEGSVDDLWGDRECQLRSERSLTLPT